MNKEIEDKVFEEIRSIGKEIIEDCPSANLLVYRIREKNRIWNKKIDEEKLPMKKDAFNIFMKHIINKTEGLPKEYYNAVYYL